MKSRILIGVALTLLSVGGTAMGGEIMATAEDVIRELGLEPLPDEGGYFREMYKSEKVNAPASIFGIDSKDPRVISTAIYYLVVPSSFSALHRLKSDEVFHFYGGDPVEMIQIDPKGNFKKFILGPDIFNGQSPQVVVKRGTWQGTRLVSGGAWALMGTTMSPGFEYSDFELGNREQLIKAYPQLRNDIIRFSREPNEKAH